LRDSDLPQEEKTIDRLKEEGFVLTAAAADATSMTLTVLSYHLMDNPEVLKRVKAELCQAQPDLNLSIPSRVLEQLPLFVSTSINIFLSFNSQNRRDQ